MWLFGHKLTLLTESFLLKWLDCIIGNKPKPGTQYHELPKHDFKTVSSTMTELATSHAKLFQISPSRNQKFKWQKVMKNECVFMLVG